MIPKHSVRTAALTAAVAAATTSLGGCGLVSQSWDVRFEVNGPGEAVIGRKFAGEDDRQVIETRRPLPWHEAVSVGFGLNWVDVVDARPGTTCRVEVNGELVEQRAVDAAGRARCRVNLQEDER
ncbi:hypothetical protein [Saccharopolyspora rosea]|uniref:MmpS family membrane protein n=1 Tax=Saccharopolyspora rosea TaxID=524884 RepID=A0ABW3FY43_9PSEU|nr:hypothetical protein [Saccharopolyspora rosea]